MQNLKFNRVTEYFFNSDFVWRVNIFIFRRGENIIIVYIRKKIIA